ncbi:MAG: hypothetical protein RR630_05135 [Coprobacillus sp.]
MRLGLISLGFLMLHLNFLPISISLTIIVLGLIYIYQDGRKSETLYLILTNILLIILSFLDTAFLFTIAKFIYIVTLLFFVEKSIVNEQDKKRFHNTILIYGMLQLMSFIPALSLLMIIQFFVSINIYLQMSHLRKITMVEDRPQIITQPKPIGISIFVVVISIVIIALTRQTFVDYTYNKASQISIYEVVSEEIKIQYFANQRISYRISNLYRGGRQPVLWMDDQVSGEKLSVEVDGRIVAEANIEFDGTHWIYSMISGLSVSDNISDSKSCVIKIDDKEYNGVVQKVVPEQYGYKDNEIKLDHCYINNGYLITLPRIQVSGKEKHIRTIAILDKDDNEIYSYDYEQNDYLSSDNTTVYLESLASYKNVSNGPYKVKIGFESQDKNDDNIEFKEYNLVKQ